MTALTRASVVRTIARLCFLVLFQTSGIYIPQLLAQSPQSEALRKEVQAIQAEALKSAQAAAAAAKNSGAVETADSAPAPFEAEDVAAAKKTGLRRVGLLLPSNKMDGNGSASESEALRAVEEQALTAAKVETVRLHASTAEQGSAEALLQRCDGVLAITVTQQTPAASGGRFSKLMNMRNVHLAATAAQFIPGVQGAAMMTNLVTSQLMQTQMLTASKAVRAGSDVRLEYTLTDASGTVKLHDSAQQHTTADGENVLAPLLSDAAKKIAVSVAD